MTVLEIVKLKKCTLLTLVMLNDEEYRRNVEGHSEKQNEYDLTSSKVHKYLSSKTINTFIRSCFCLQSTTESPSKFLS